jgi:hypothetical protein
VDLSRAIEIGDREGALTLLAQSPSELDEALRIASRFGKRELVELFLAMGADVNQHDEWEGRTALLEACSGKHADVARLLLDHGASPNATDGYDSDARECAFDDLPLERLLIERGFEGRGIFTSFNVLAVNVGVCNFAEPMTATQRSELHSPEGALPDALKLGFYLDRQLPVAGRIGLVVNGPDAIVFQDQIDARETRGDPPHYFDVGPAPPGEYELEVGMVGFIGRMVVKLFWDVQRENAEFFTQWLVRIRAVPATTRAG